MGDPVEVTYFYTKDKPWKAIRGDDVSYSYSSIDYALHVIKSRET